MALKEPCNETFRCEFCKKSFKKFAQLKGHSQIHSTKKKYTCAFRFQNPSKVKVHSHIRTGEELYECQMCSQSFFKINQLKKHTKYYHSNNKQPHINSNNGKVLGKPKANINSTLGSSLECHFCPRVFNFLYKYEEHLKSHSGGSCIRCEICGNGYPNLKDYQLHKEGHNEELKLKYQCHICGDNFEQFLTLELHLNEHSDKQDLKLETCRDKDKKTLTARKKTPKLRNGGSEGAEIVPARHVIKETSQIDRKHKTKTLPIKTFVKVLTGTNKIFLPVQRDSFTCIYCSRKFTVERIWLKHTRRHLAMVTNGEQKEPFRNHE